MVSYLMLVAVRTLALSSAFTGNPYLRVSSQALAILLTHAKKTTFQNPYWATEAQMKAFGTQPKEGEVGFRWIGGNRIFNAEQTMHPERFTDENCQGYDLLRCISGTESPSTVMSELIRAHTIVNNLPKDTVWSTADALGQCGVALRPDALPLTFTNTSKGGSLETVYGTSQGGAAVSRQPHKAPFAEIRF
jgi:hypothetical protein